MLQKGKIFVVMGADEGVLAVGQPQRLPSRDKGLAGREKFSKKEQQKA